MRTTIVLTFLVAIVAIGSLSFITIQDQKTGGPWDIPQEYIDMENPHKGDSSLDRLGRAGYARHCRSCHGRNGEGDGPMAAQLETFPGDFTKAEWHEKYNDGEIYYMSFVGRDEMPNFESNITDIEERWAIVNYIRSLKD